MKYKIGDKVLIRPDLEVGKRYGDEIVISDMLFFKEKIVIIKHIEDHPDCYRIEEDPDQWHWTDEMFLPITKYNIGDKVRVREDLEVDQWYGQDTFASGMSPFKGKVVTISYAEYGFYRLKEDSSKWS